jgi:hypothetical protein
MKWRLVRIIGVSFSCAHFLVPLLITIAESVVYLVANIPVVAVSIILPRSLIPSLTTIRLPLYRPCMSNL